MEFKTMYCGGRVNPLGTGRELMFHWNYTGDGKRNEKQLAYRIQIRESGKDPAVDSGRIEGSAMQYFVGAEDGLQPETLYLWQVTAWTEEGEIQSPLQHFETAAEDLDSAAWIGCGTDVQLSAPVFSRSFTPAGKVAKARVYVTGLGFIHCQINGKDCDHGRLAPPNTVYEQKCYFETLDITDSLTEGENRFTVQLGGGYNEDYSKWGYRYFKPKGLRTSIRLVYEDGTAERIDTDGAWMWQDSPITANGLYLGEEYDARLTEFPLHSAVLQPENAPAGKLLPDEMPRLSPLEVLTPAAQWKTEEGTVYDFGKIMQGVSSICVSAPAGCEIRLQHCEMLYPDGKPDLFTNRGARAMDIYICAGTGEESYTPKFTYHGFRYVYVTSSVPMEQFRIRAWHVSADVRANTEFSCSEPILNRLHMLCRNSMQANFSAIPTDCPVRDERTPCLMDSQMYEDAAMYNFNMYAYYKKWLGDIAAEPEKICGGNMDWYGDGMMLTYRLYRFYGDMEPARKLYPHLKKAMENWLEKSENGVWPGGYGDWCLPNENTWETFFGCQAAVNTSLLHAYTGIMAEFAELFGKPEDKAQFAAMGKTVREGFISRFWHEDGTVGEGRQPEMFLPLFYGILTGERAEKTRGALLAKIREDGCFDTGGFGSRTVLPVLAEAGASDLALEILRKNTYPGYGYLTALGATTLWEQWASKGNMHSHSHAMHSGVDAALFHVLCGVTPTAPGFGTFAIAPKLPEDMRYTACRLDTYAGQISVRVEKFSDMLELSCEIPPNTEADLILPQPEGDGEYLLFDGERQIENRQSMHLGSGRYHFRLVPERYIRFQPYNK